MLLLNEPKVGYKVVFKPGSFGIKYAGANQPGLDLERALVDFVLIKGLATNPSGDCCTLVAAGGGEGVLFSNGLTDTPEGGTLGGDLTENTVVDGGTDFSMSFTDLTNFTVTADGPSAESELVVSGTVANPTRLTHYLGSDLTKFTGVFLDVDNQSQLVYTDSVGSVGFRTINDNVGTTSRIALLTEGVKEATVATRQFLRLTNVDGTSEFENMTIAPNRQVASYVLALSDVDKIVEMNVAGVNTLTVPANATVAFPIGTHIKVIQYGGGPTTITPAGGVTINSEGGMYDTNQLYAVVELIKVATNEWHLYGNRA